MGRESVRQTGFKMSIDNYLHRFSIRFLAAEDKRGTRKQTTCGFERTGMLCLRILEEVLVMVALNNDIVTTEHGDWQGFEKHEDDVVTLSSNRS